MPRHSHRAFTIVEVTAAAAMLALALAMFVPTLHLVQTQRRETALHRKAIMAADNLLERVLAVQWSDIQSDLPGDAIGAGELLDALPGGRWTLEVVEVSDRVPAKRVTVEVAYRTRFRTGAVPLTAWVYDASPNGRGT